jgi:asparagine synthase (glutamine-hydrolysing)
MCGIVGVLHPQRQTVAIDELASLLKHRGPDGVGHHLGGGIALAARRLAIVDRDGGRQPLANETGQVWTVHNGEIVNARALRSELGAAGHRFATRSDTEVLVHGWEEWGPALAGRLRGMFAFAVWDGDRRQLYLARDRFGIKPLYYARNADHFAFGSSARVVLDAVPGLKRRLDPIALEQLFDVGFVAAPRSMFFGVRRLPAAHTLLVTEHGDQLQRYWRLSVPPTHHDRPTRRESPGALVRARLEEAVSAWSASDVPIAVLLSGGLDSTAVAVLLRELHGSPPDTFTVGFEHAPYDERSAASAAAEVVGGRHHEVTIGDADFDLLPEVTRHSEQPLCSATAVPLYRVFEHCRRAGFASTMTGEGADELFGGYQWYAGDRWARPLLAVPVGVRRLLAASPLPMSQAARRVVSGGPSDPRIRYALWQQVAAESLRERLLTGRHGPDTSWSDLVAADDLQDRHPFDQFVLIDATTRLPNLLNLEVDAMSMAHGVEARPPLLDHELWTSCAALSPRTKLGLRTTKLVLRQAVGDLLPDRVARRRKQGLAAPHGLWWRRERLPDWAEDCLTPSALGAVGYFDPPTVAALRARHRARIIDAAGVLTGVLTTQLWHGLFIAGHRSPGEPIVTNGPAPASTGEA